VSHVLYGKSYFYTPKSEIHTSNVTVPWLECVIIYLVVCFTLNCQFMREHEFT